MKLVTYMAEGIAFIFVSIFLFNVLSQFLQILGLFDNSQISHIGMISILLVANNLLTKTFFGIKLFE